MRRFAKISSYDRFLQTKDTKNESEVTQTLKALIGGLTRLI